MSEVPLVHNVRTRFLRDHHDLTDPGGYSGPEALKLIETGAADLVSFASLFLANPDLPRRLQRSGPFNTPDYSLAYGGDHRGYIDYPRLSQATHDDGQQPVS